MSEEVQERFEDYLELEQYIEQLHSQSSARPPANLTPQQTRIYGMAMLFHAATPRVADPRPEFKEQLQQRLLAQLRAEEAPTVPLPSQKQLRRIYTHNPAPTSVTRPKSAESVVRKSMTQKLVSFLGQSAWMRTIITKRATTSTDVEQSAASGVARGPIPLPRRTLLTGGTVAAASLLSGAAIGAAIDHSLESQPDTAPPDQSLLVQDVAATWFPVASLEQLGQDPIRFTSDTIIGYVMRQTKNSNGVTTEQIVAFSAACTHLGCLVQWQENTRQFLCPCHDSTFDATGDPADTQHHRINLTSLPRLETTIKNGNIYVRIPLMPTQQSVR